MVIQCDAMMMDGGSLRELQIFENCGEKFALDWPREFRATADPCYDLHTCTAGQGGRKGHCIGGRAAKVQRQTHRVHSVHTAGAENTIF